jgi:hypothetical protein
MIKKELEKNKYYKKIELIYTVYDSKNYDLPIGQFDSLEDLYNFINNKINKMNFNSLKNTISKNYNILDRYYIIKDKIDLMEV